MVEDRRQVTQPTVGITHIAQLLLPPQRLSSQVQQPRVRTLLLSNQPLIQPRQSNRLLRPVVEAAVVADRRQVTQPTVGITHIAQLLLPPQRLSSQVQQPRVRTLLLSNQPLIQPRQSNRLLRPVVEAVVEGLVPVRAWKSNGQAIL